MSLEPTNNQQQAQSFGDIFVGDGGSLMITQTMQVTPADVQTFPLIEVSPYKGLKRFGSKDKDVFFGRDQLIISLIDAVKANNLTLLLGASGSGKSSIIRAGLIPRLSKSVKYFTDFTFTPDRDPFESLRSSLTFHNYKKEQIEFILEGNPNTLSKIIQLLKEEKSQWLIFIDQFEELFTDSQGTQVLERRKNFITSIVEIAKSQDSSVKIIIAMRAEFLDKFSSYPEFAEIVEKNIHIMRDMYSDELRLAIEQPAIKNGVTVQPELVEKIIRDIQGQAAALPLLQYTLDLLWENDDISDRKLNLVTYNELGGVRGALQKHVDKIYNNFNEKEKSEVKQIFLRLVDIVGSFETSNLVGLAVSRRAYLSDFPNERSLRNTLEKLINANLIVSNRERQVISEENPTIEIAHEILIGSWVKFKNWIEDSKRVIAVRHRVAEDAQKWHKLSESSLSKNNEFELWTGSKLDEVLEFQQKGLFQLVLGELNEEQNDFIRESKSLRDRILGQEKEKEKQEKSRKKTLVSLVSVLALSVLSAFGLWHLASSRAKENKSLQLSNASATNLNIDPTLSIWLAIGANKLTPDTADANLALWNALEKNHERYQLIGHKKEVLQAEFSPGDSKKIITVSKDKVALVWDLNNLTAHPVELSGHTDTVKHGTFDSRNGNRVLTVSYDGTARIWNLKDINNPTILKGHKAPINYGSFDPKDSNKILTVSSDGTARVWDINNINNPLVLKGHEGDVWFGAFDPNDSNKVLTVGSDSLARVWNLKQPDKPLVLKGHKSQIPYGEFDPNNSNRVLTVSSDKTTRIWNLSTPETPIVLQGHLDKVNHGTFSPQDSNKVLTVSDDATARLWNLNQPDKPQVLRGHEDKIFFGTFNPENNNQILTVSQDKTAKVWDLSTSSSIFTLRGHTERISFGAFNPKHSNQILTVSDDLTARIWDINSITSKQIVADRKAGESSIIANIFSSSDPNKILTVDSSGIVKKLDFRNPTDIKLVSEIGSIKKAWFAPSNTNRIASISLNGKFHIWDLNKSSQPIELPKGEGKVIELRFDPRDDNRILRINDNHTVTIWQIKDKKILKELPSVSLIGEAEFDPNNPNRVVTGSKDGTILIWNLEDRTKQPELKFSANRQPIWHIAFDKNNLNYILTMGSDNVARVWDLSNLSIKAELSGHKRVVVDGSFDSNNSNRVITTSQDGSTRIWDLKKSDIPLIIRGKVGMVSGSFIPHNSNEIITLDSDGKLLSYTVGGKELVTLSQDSISRCLTESELSNYELKWLSSESKYLINKAYCHEKTFVQNKKKNNSLDAAILPTWYPPKLYESR